MLMMLAGWLFMTTPELPLYRPERAKHDWLVESPVLKSGVYRTERGIALSNGLVTRTFQISPDAATVGLDDLSSGESLLRAVGPEAVIEIDGKRVPVGGLVGQPNRAFLTDAWLAHLRPDPEAIHFTGYDVGDPEPRMTWRRNRPAVDAAWPPKGKALTLHFAGHGMEVDVRYEIYDGIPLIGKRVRVRNVGAKAVRLTGFETENLSLVEGESSVDPSETWRKPPVTVVTDYSFAGMAMGAANRTVRWETEPDYKTQVNYELKTPCRLVVKPPLGPDAEIPPQGTFDTFWTFTLVHDSTERERQGLAIRRMYRPLAPWATENPLMLHLTSTDPEVVHRAMDQAADVGFEMVIFSFGSGLNMEDASPENIAKFKAFADYGHAKGLEVGGYSLLASRHIDDANDAINPKTGKPGGAIFGFSPCLQSEWGRRYFANVRKFLAETSFDLLEHDGSYPGDVCASTSHPGHRGLADSQWSQYAEIAEFYRWCREKGIFLNVPDHYFLAGSNKTGMGYRESNWSLPRAEQHIHARQNLFDGTWEKAPSMGWMFTPLVEYQGGGAAATIEPLKDHLQDYALHLMNNLGYGAQACYRGPRLYDFPETRAVVVRWVNWFKAHRAILESDVVHLRRADGRNLDGILHVNPHLETKGMAVIYNPLDRPLKEEMAIPLYYAGLKDRARMRVDGGRERSVTLDRQGWAFVTLEVPAYSCLSLAFRPAP